MLVTRQANKRLTLLNKKQKAAVESDGDIVVVRAPAGSGKTKILVERTLREVRAGRRPVVITFTRAAAREVEDRIGDLSGVRYCGTIHGLAFDLLRAQPEHLPKSLVRGRHGEWGIAAASVTSVAESMCAVTGSDPRSQLHMSGLVSYDELLTHATEALESGMDRGAVGCDVVLVDEAQDLTLVEWRFVRLLCGRRFIVGDAAQAIYGWRGGQVGEFLKEYMRADDKVDLEVNYRSEADIINAANKLPVKGRVTMKGTRKADPETSSLCTLSTAAAISVLREAEKNNDDCVVVARTRRSANSASAALGTAGIMHKAPIQYADVWSSPGGSLVAAAIHVLTNPFDDLHLSYLLSCSGLDDASLLRIEAERAVEMKPMWSFLGDRGPDMLGYWAPVFQVFVDAVALYKDTEISEAFFVPQSAQADSSSWWASVCHVVEAVIRTEIPEQFIFRPLLIKETLLRQVCMALQVARAWSDHPMSDSDSGPAGFLSWLADPHTSESILLSESVGDEGPSILVTTIHGAKGGEWDRVVFWDCVEGLMPTYGDIREERSLNEARRLFYVATTRAKKDVLYVIGDDDSRKSPSRFLREAGVA